MRHWVRHDEGETGTRRAQRIAVWTEGSQDMISNMISKVTVQSNSCAVRAQSKPSGCEGSSRR